MPRSLIIVLTTLAASALALLLFSTDVPGKPQPVNRPDPNSPPSSQQLPPPLHPQLPQTAEAPHNPCNKLVIPEEIQKNVAQLSRQQKRAQINTERLFKQHTLPSEIERGDQKRKAVALTIDTGTGGSGGIDQMLSIAAHYHIPLTFFVTGCWAVENPELLQRIVVEGHSIANHTLTHLNLGLVSDDVVTQEISETDRLIKETTGITPVIFRKPLYAGGQRVTDIAGRLGKISVLGFPDFGDTTGWRKGVTADDVRTLVERKTAPGSIWVFHNLSLADLGAFEDIVRFHLQERYSLLSVEDLLTAPGK